MSAEWISLVVSIAGSAATLIGGYAVLQYRVGKQDERLAELSATMQVNKSDTDDKIDECRKDLTDKLDQYRDATNKRLDDIKDGVADIAVGVARIQGQMEKRS